MLQDYTPQQSRIDAAFHSFATCTSIRCERCQRLYFVTSPGHGDYEDGQLERLREFAKQKPNMFIEVSDYSCVSAMCVDGKQVVIGCLCDPTQKYSDFIEQYAEELTEYLKLYWKSVHKEAQNKSMKSSRALNSLIRSKE